MKKYTISFLALAGCLFVITGYRSKKQVVQESSQGVSVSTKHKTKTGLEYIDEVVGDGVSPKQGQTVTVHYTGWLEDANNPGNADKSKKFDSSRDRNQPFSFPIGAGHVIKGWDEGVMSMKVGGKRTLIIPAELGYGARGAGGVIPPNATLVFDVELISVS